ncbi:MAG: hypothetical protein K0S46_1907 [Moraxellaceae bacterium]|jgi:hypothetical protein|nr:hypothetical protein [Moraxellaceae bacterium]
MRAELGPEAAYYLAYAPANDRAFDTVETKMSKQVRTGVVEQLEAVRTALREQPLTPERRAEMEAALTALEQEFQVAEPADPAPLLDLLRDWEARLEAEHPVLSRVVSEALQKLSAIGI